MAGKLRQEWGRIKNNQYIVELRENGKLELVDKEQVETAQSKLSGLKSDDPHIIALAQVSGSNLLVSDDQNLHKDFKNLIPNGMIYKTARHKNLLQKTKCQKP